MLPKVYSTGRDLAPQSIEAEFVVSRLGYKEIKKYLRTPPNNYPRFLYKYVNPNTPLEWIEDYLVHGDFWLSSRDVFNDPFDMATKAILDAPVKDKRKRIEELVKSQNPGLKRKVFEATVTKLMLADTFTSGRFTELLKNNLDKIGVLCFSKDPKNLLMWSHYAQHHKGMVLQFELARDPFVMTGAFPVEYSNEYPLYYWFKNDDDHQLTKIMLRKHEGWSYEQEHRIVRIGEPNMHLHIKPAAITGIIFGCRASVEFKGRLKAVLQKRLDKGHPNVREYLAVKHESKYQLRILAP